MITESERSSTLDTVHEGKLISSGQLQYNRVYPDWKPSTTIDKTDVVSAMEAIEGAHVKDKSSLRKSNLNVSNSSEPIGNRKYPSLLLKNDNNQKKLGENDSRKDFISSLANQPTTDRLKIYIRRPSDSPSPSSNETSPVRQKLRQNDENIPPHSTLRRNNDLVSNNKIEIDSDNIETPPATRRVFESKEEKLNIPPTPCRRLDRSIETPPEGVDNTSALGDGQFDRFSSARRTRRYKRSTDNYNSASDSERPVYSPLDKPEESENETRLKRWQDRLNKSDAPIPLPKIASRGRLRNQTSIDADDVRSAFRAVGNKINEKQQQHENDEGFEETQSLMSESPSQGASSGGGCESELNSPQIIISDYNLKPDSKSNENRVLPVRTSRSLAPKTITQDKKSIIPRRSTSLKKIAVPPQPRKNTSVERSSSRSSLLSSRSSLNSATSVNTVKKAPIPRQLPLKTQIKSTVVKRHLSVTPPKTIVRKTPSKTSLSGSAPSVIGSTASTSVTQRPPRPTFMKPTTSSSTKTNVSLSQLTRNVTTPTASNLQYRRTPTFK